MSYLKKLGASAFAVTTAAGLALAGAPTASAATNPYTATEACGAGYHVINSRPAKSGSQTWADVYLLYKTGGYNCVATIKRAFIGVATETMAGLDQDIEHPEDNFVDIGKYKYYAVAKGYTPACVSYGGWVDNANGSVTAVATSGWGWCS